MSVSRRGKRWYVRFTLDGREYTSSLPLGCTKREAENEEAAMRLRASRGQHVRRSTLTVAQYCAEWLTAYSDAAEPRTRDHHRWAIGHVVRELGDLKLHALRAAQIVAMYVALRTRGLAERSVRHVHVVLHLALRHAVQWGYLAVNPVDAAPSPRPPARTRELVVLTPQQLDRLLEATAGSRSGGVIAVLALTGIRISEATALRWRDVNLADGTVTVAQTYQRIGGVGVFKPRAKTAAGVRRLGIGGRLRAALDLARRTVASNQLRAGAAYDLAGHDLVFAGPLGAPISVDIVRDDLRRALAGLGLPHMGPHGLRHTWATIALHAGMPSHEVSRTLGHASIATTHNLYAQWLVGAEQDIARRFEAALNNDHGQNSYEWRAGGGR